MSFNIIVKPEAIRDIIEASVWYDEKRQGLGIIFEEQAWKFISLLKDYALHHQTIHHNFRQVSIKQFPYVIVYRIKEKDVIVISVYHTSRHPKKKFKK